MRSIQYLATLLRAGLLSLPTVDLGYSVQLASSFNRTGQYYTFSNIRYAQPPVGPLRFAAPVPPKRPADGHKPLDNGHLPRICAQAAPAWEATAASFLPKYLTGDPNAASALQGPSASLLGSSQNGGMEDCLFLDVLVPQKVFQNRGKTGGAPVLVWIHGGGFVGDSKVGSHNPAGLLARSDNNIIYVAINYRLGLFGWLGGATVQANGVANAGLLDQRLALEWVREEIGKFGGDRNRVTVMGQSAGGGAIMHHLTSFNGTQPLPFQQAIVQSPAFVPVVDRRQPEQLTQAVLAALRVKSIDGARHASFEDLQKVNRWFVGLSPYGQYTFGPVVDGSYVADAPGKLLLEGASAKNVRVIAGHTSDEGLIPTSPHSQNVSYYNTQLASVFPRIRPEVAAYISQTLYPPVFDGSFGYRDGVQRVALTISDAFYACNAVYLDQAYQGSSYGYEWSMPPGLHAVDLPYTFYDGPDTRLLPSSSSSPPSSPQSEEPNMLQTLALSLQFGRVADPNLAADWQEYLTSFVVNGMPTTRGGRVLPDQYGQASRVMGFGVHGAGQIIDPSANDRCRWWQRGLYL
ncbi:MAG: hypothetical protein M1826_000424 [Phylliscum demangeonii]|nr:MAG: hypothetical protein M1826_000424 [Phylliscum demangeonii]